jgi:hypothetical protein
MPPTQSVPSSVSRVFAPAPGSKPSFTTCPQRNAFLPPSAGSSRQPPVRNPHSRRAPMQRVPSSSAGSSRQPPVRNPHSRRAPMQSVRSSVNRVFAPAPGSKPSFTTCPNAKRSFLRQPGLRASPRFGPLLLLSRVFAPAPGSKPSFTTCPNAKRSFLRQPGLRASPRFGGSNTRGQLAIHHARRRATGTCQPLLHSTKKKRWSKFPSTTSSYYSDQIRFPCGKVSYLGLVASASSVSSRTRVATGIAAVATTGVAAAATEAAAETTTAAGEQAANSRQQAANATSNSLSDARTATAAVATSTWVTVAAARSAADGYRNLFFDAARNANGAGVRNL